MTNTARQVATRPTGANVLKRLYEPADRHLRLSPNDTGCAFLYPHALRFTLAMGTQHE